MTFTWTWVRSTRRLTVVCTGLTPAATYQMVAGLWLSAEQLSTGYQAADGGGGLTLVLTDVDLLGPGNLFHAHVTDFATETVLASNVFTVQTSSSGDGLTAAFSHDGGVNYTVQVQTVLGVNYQFFVFPATAGTLGGGNISWVGNGTLETKTIDTTADPIAGGLSVRAILTHPITGAWFVLASGLQVQGSAGAATSVNPGGGTFNATLLGPVESPEGAWVFGYNGTNIATATGSGLVPGRTYAFGLDVVTAAGTMVMGTASGGGTLVLTQTGIVDPSGSGYGPGFYAWVTGGPFDGGIFVGGGVGKASTMFEYGTASSGGAGLASAEWTYDGVESGTVSLQTAIGVEYDINSVVGQVDDVDGPITGDGTVMTINWHLRQPPPDPDDSFLSSQYIVAMYNNTVFEDLSVHQFEYGVVSPTPPTLANEGIRIAFGSDTHDIVPAWTRIDDPNYPAVSTNSNVVQGWETHRGRQYELDKTQAGTAVLNIFDSTGRLDPSNTSGPYYGDILPLKQTKINVQNPVDGSYHDIFTGYVESWQYQLTPDEQVLMINANLTDGFELLARAEVVPDGTGTTTYAAAQVNTRILSALADADWPSDYTNIFTGNIDMQETVYNPQTSILAVIQDAADAEFPNVANIFMDKFGNVAFRGRWSRFNPSHYSADPPTASRPIRFWSVGDREAAETFVIAPIQNIEWNLDLKNVINACLCMPFGILQKDISGQLMTDPTSITQYGVRALSIPDLLILNSIAGPAGPPFPTTNPGGDGVGKPSAVANDECQIIADYYITNYAQPVEMISSISFQSVAPTDTLGPAWWKFVTGVEIGDVVTVTQSNPGGGGFKATQFFVEGIHNVVNLGSPSGPGRLAYPQWTMNLDLTPRLWYSVFDGVTYYP